tara:strand:+ start:193 stop:396 length:204 start_codon:yes stop_codon:yes gene_type:complete
MLIISRTVVIVDGSKSIKCSRDLEHLCHFILQKLLSFAIIVEAMAAQIVDVLLDAASVINGVVDNIC